MTLLFCDGFEHYGTDENNMDDGPYLQHTGNLSTAQARTGTYSFATSGSGGIRRSLGSSLTTVGCFSAIYLSALPGASRYMIPFSFRDVNNVRNLDIVIGTTGRIEAWRYNNPTPVLLGQSSFEVPAEAWFHLEVKAVFSQTVGTVEARYNGVTILSLTGLDNIDAGLVEASQIMFGFGNVVSGVVYYLDDIGAWSTAGSYNNSFIGDKRVITLFPNADTATADWTLNGAGTSYGCVDEVAPDDDTTYLESNVVNDKTHLEFEALPANVAAVLAVVSVDRIRKTDAGGRLTRSSLISNSVVAEGTDHAPSTAYTYYQDIFEQDPDTVAPWAVAAVNAVLKRIKITG